MVVSVESPVPKLSVESLVPKLSVEAEVIVEPPSVVKESVEKSVDILSVEEVDVTVEILSVDVEDEVVEESIFLHRLISKNLPL